MIHLQPMTEGYFADYYRTGLTAYARQGVACGQWTDSEALALSTREYEVLLPDGLASADSYLFEIREHPTGETLGALWVRAQLRGSEAIAFVYDIVIHEAHRQRGLATQALRAVEGFAVSKSLTAVALHVFGTNHQAIALYSKLGYEVTNLCLYKSLGGKG